MQAVVAELLDDADFVDSFLESSRQLLQSSYVIVTGALEEMKIPYIKAQAGIFVYCDFSSLLPEQSFEGEARLASLLEKCARVVMTPGHSQRDEKPGMFRICYAWVDIEVLRVALDRLKCVTFDIRENGWESISRKNQIYYRKTCK